jgi:hypothetical protein
VNPLHRSTRRAIGALGLMAIFLGLTAAPAAAAPSFQVEVDNGAHEVQRVEVIAKAGQFKLTFNGSTTSDLAFNATIGQVQSALNALPSIGGAGGAVSVMATVSGGYFVTFNGGIFAHTNVAELTATNGSTPLSGGQPRTRVSIVTIGTADVHRGDQRVDYTVNVKNTAPVAPLVAGDTLKCSPSTWSGNGSPTFTYTWLRNGTPIAGATASTYTTVAPADQGAVIQCQVIATNTVANVSNPADFVGSTRASAGVIVEPQPATAPPTPPGSIATPAQTGSLVGTASQELTCNAGTWSGAPTSFSYQWFRNGAPLGAPVGPTAETSTKLTLTAAEQSPPAAYQCSVTGTNAGGSRTKTSGNRVTAGTLFPNPEAPNNENSLFITTPNQTGGPVTVELELPAGLETFAYKFFDPTSLGEGGPNGWSCSAQAPVGAQPAKAICGRTDSLSPGASYPPLAVAAALGADAPGHAVAKATVSGGGGTPASDTDAFDFAPATPFDIKSLTSIVAANDAWPVTTRYTQAGGHPFAAGASFSFVTYRTLFGIKLSDNQYEPVENPRLILTDTPRGFVGNALAVPRLCSGLAAVKSGACPAESAVGGVTARLSGIQVSDLPIYAIEPEYGVPAQFAFAEPLSQTTYSFVPRLRADDGYAITLEASPAAVSPKLLAVDATLCTVGAKLRPGTSGRGDFNFNGCKKVTDADANPKPLITNPTRCAGQPPTVKLSVDTWQHPGDFKTRESIDPSPTGCEKVDFQPEVKLHPTSAEADSPTGLDVEFTMPPAGLENPKGLSQANLDNAIVTFPKGMSVNPASAHGLSACTPAQVKLGSNADDECPLSSRIGTVEIDTPLIREPLTGHVYLASQLDNPFKSTIGLYMVFSSKKDGVTIKVAGKLAPDPVTGQLTSSFVENPEAPFSRLVLHFNEGPRAPLINPPKCGSYAIHSELSPWSAASPANPTNEEIVAADSTYQVTSGPNGSPCPQGNLDPDFEAGLSSPAAGSKSPFALKLSREDGSQRFTALDVSMPPGLTAYLKGVPYCPDHVLAGISGEELTGRAELANPACPAASQIGTVQAGAGAGPYPFYAPGKVFLAGPYKGAPISIVIVTPAVAGPFDLGNVVVRNPLYIDPVTSQVTVVSDPIPTMLHGLLLDVKDIRVNIGRPNFTAAPTNCEAKTIGARIGGEQGASVTRSNRFQVGDCAALGFKPKLELRLFGGTKRGSHPRLSATLTARPGDANIAAASVALPHSEFLDQAHIRTVCTRSQFATKTCPDAAIYGHAEAVTPLLDSPLSGPVYLRSSDNPLPDLVAALRGPDSQPIEVVLDGRVDSATALTWSPISR